MSLQIPFLETEMHLSNASEALGHFLYDEDNLTNDDLLSEAKSSLDNARFELGLAGFENGDEYAKKVYSEVEELMLGLSEVNMERTSFELDKIVHSEEFRIRVSRDNKKSREAEHGFKINL